MGPSPREECPRSQPARRRRAPRLPRIRPGHQVRVRHGNASDRRLMRDGLQPSAGTHSCGSREAPPPRVLRCGKTPARIWRRGISLWHETMNAPIHSRCFSGTPPLRDSRWRGSFVEICDESSRTARSCRPGRPRRHQVCNHGIGLPRDESRSGNVLTRRCWGDEPPVRRVYTVV